MPILATDIKLYHSGGAANADPNASLGGIISTTQITDNSLHNLFDKISGAEAEAGDIEYRCIFIKNTHASLTYQGVKIYISTNTPSPSTDVNISVATESGSPVQTIANESAAPSAQTFSNPTNIGTALTIGDLAPGASKGIWIKRVVTAGASAFANDSVILSYEGDTDA